MRALLRGAVVAAALSLAPVAVVTTSAAPAHAATTVNTKTKFQSDVRKNGVYGSTFIISGAVETTNDPDGYGPLAGTAYLQRQAPGSKAWKNVAKDESPGYAYFPAYGKYKANSKFRIYYTGGTYGAGTSTERNYPASVSKVIKSKVFRKIDFRSVSGKRVPTADVKISPKFGKKKVLVQKKQGKGFKPFRKFKTNKKGKVRISVPGTRNGTKYRLIAPGNKQFSATKLRFTATRY